MTRADESGCGTGAATCASALDAAKPTTPAAIVLRNPRRDMQHRQPKNGRGSMANMEGLPAETRAPRFGDRNRIRPDGPASAKREGAFMARRRSCAGHQTGSRVRAPGVQAPRE